MEFPIQISHENMSCLSELMRIVYTFQEAKQNLALLLDQAAQEGEVRVKRKDGQTFVIRPEKKEGSPLDVEGVDLNISTAEIVQFIRESRRAK